MTKEGILDKREAGNDAGVYSDPQIYIAMDEYAKQQAIAFGEWVDVNAVRNGFHVWTVGCGESKKDYTSEQLYNKFIEQQNSK